LERPPSEAGELITWLAKLTNKVFQNVKSFTTETINPSDYLPDIQNAQPYEQKSDTFKYHSIKRATTIMIEHIRKILIQWLQFPDNLTELQAKFTDLILCTGPGQGILLLKVTWEAYLNVKTHTLTSCNEHRTKPSDNFFNSFLKELLEHNIYNKQSEITSLVIELLQEINDYHSNLTTSQGRKDEFLALASPLSALSSPTTSHSHYDDGIKKFMDFVTKA
jgi:hypothetical protein